MLLFHLTSSILNLLAWWLRNLDRVDAETMAEIIERTVLTPVGALRKQPPEGLGGRPRLRGSRGDLLGNVVLKDDPVQPLAQGHARAPGKVLRDLAGLRVDPLDTPGRPRAHPNR